MSDKRLLPFDFEEFKADPTRLRDVAGNAPVWAEPVRDCLVVVKWSAFFSKYDRGEFNFLRLAPKSRTVQWRHWIDSSRMMRLWESRHNESQRDVEQISYFVRWLDEGGELEIEE